MFGKTRLGICLLYLKTMLFGDICRTIISLICAVAVVIGGPGLLKWLIVDATFIGTAETCRENGGACWAFLHAKFNLILFGAYPSEYLWRPSLFLCLLGLLAFWIYFNPRRIFYGLGALGIIFGIGLVIMQGGFFGLPVVDTARWGGLPITLLVTIAGLGGAFPLGVFLMLGSTSHITILRFPCKIYVEIIRGIPAITLVFMTFAILPLLTPEGILIDKLVRASFGLILLTAAYFAEALRGGREALPRGMAEAAASLSLGYWKTQWLVILPQVIGNSIQPIANIIIAFIKNTSLLIIICLFDLLGSARSSLFDGAWQGFYKELYLLIGFIYLGICLFLENYMTRIENERSKRLSH